MMRPITSGCQKLGTLNKVIPLDSVGMGRGPYKGAESRANPAKKADSTANGCGNGEEQLISGSGRRVATHKTRSRDEAPHPRAETAEGIDGNRGKRHVDTRQPSGF